MKRKPPIVGSRAWCEDRSIKETQMIIGLCLKERLNSDNGCVGNFVTEFFLITQANLILSWEAISLNIQQKQQCTGKDRITGMIFA